MARTVGIGIQDFEKLIETKHLRYLKTLDYENVEYIADEEEVKYEPCSMKFF